MNRRTLLMMCFALLLAAFAAWVANRWIQGKIDSSQVTTVPIVVAAAELPYGTKLEASHVKVIDWPSKSVPDGTFSTTDKVINSVTLNKFYPGEVITDKRISQHLGGSTLSALITKKFRALSVRVDDVVGVAGFILPGNKVDVLATKVDKTINQANTKTLLQDIKVLAVDQEAGEDKDKPSIVKAVTLELTPEQAEKIVQAMQEGTIQLTLRNPLDNEDRVIPAEPIKVPPPILVQPKPVEKIPEKKRVLKVIPW